MPTSRRLPSTRIGKYRLIAHIADGGMGAVYKAQDEEFERLVALKVLHPQLASNATVVERFRREARHASQLLHKNIVTLYEFGQADGMYFIALEFIEGIDLAEYIRRKGRVEPEEARRIIVQACKGLEVAFSQGITHRDIKPSNFLLANVGEGRCRVKLTDLGLARAAEDEEFRVTRAGTTVGTVDYMAPEQARDSSRADVRSDIYSLGCTLYHMLTGQPPFNEGGLGERVLKHITADPRDVRQFNADIPAGLWTILRRMLAKHPDDRFQTPAELLEALKSIPQNTGEGEQTDLPLTATESTRRSRVKIDDRPSSLGSFQLPPELPPAGSPPAPPQSPVTLSVGRPAPRQRPTTPTEVRTAAEPLPPDRLSISPDQRQAAALQYERAAEARATGNGEYALQLLLSCCKLDPVNIDYRRALREVIRLADRKRGSWFGALADLPLRRRVRAARAAGEHRKALELGEELLARVPDDLGVQLDLANSAEELGWNNLALWMLEQARRQASENTGVLKALAELLERLNRLPQAIVLWEQLHEADPADSEAAQKIKDLSVNEVMARNRARR
jgi:serine/threonine-protein kinase